MADNRQNVLVFFDTKADDKAIKNLQGAMTSLKNVQKKLNMSSDELSKSMKDAGISVKRTGGFVQEGEQDALSNVEAMEKLSDSAKNVGSSNEEAAQALMHFGDQLKDNGVLLRQHGDKANQIKDDLADVEDKTYDLSDANARLAIASKELGRDMEATQETLSKAGMELVSVKDQQADSEKRQVKVRDQLTGETMDLSQGMRQAGASARDFRSELLSNMFFAMQLSQTMGNLLGGSIDAMGGFDLLSATLTQFFLPVGRMVLAIVQRVRQFMMAIPGPIRKVINVIALMAYIFAAAFSTLTIFHIGWNGFMTTLEKSSPIMTGVKKAMAGIKAMQSKLFMWSRLSSAANLAEATTWKAKFTAIMANVAAYALLIGQVLLIIGAIVAVVSIISTLIAEFTRFNGIKDMIGSGIDYLIERFGALEGIVKKAKEMFSKFMDMIPDFLTSFGKVSDKVEGPGGPGSGKFDPGTSYADDAAGTTYKKEETNYDVDAEGVNNAKDIPKEIDYAMGNKNTLSNSGE